MKFKLLFYTNDWEVGPAIEMEHIPSTGSVVWIKDRRRRGEDLDMYYVDNIMYSESGVDRDESIYLYVRPYNGYSEYAPLTETDRVTEKIHKLSDEIKAVSDELSDLNRKFDSLSEQLNGMGRDIEERQREMNDQLYNIGYTISEMKDLI